MNRLVARTMIGPAIGCATFLALCGVAAAQQSPDTELPRSTSPMLSSLRLDVNQSVRFLEAGARPTSGGRCAQVVSRALEAGGLDVKAPDIHAKDFGPVLERSGFKKLPAEGYVPEPGDVVVLQPYRGGPSTGHVAIFTGKQWISDFRQKDFYGGSGYRKGGAAYAFYRHANVVVASEPPVDATKPRSQRAAGTKPHDAAMTEAAKQAEPKDEQTEKLQRRAKELAEKGLKPRDPAAAIDPNEAKPIIPEDCTIEIVTWRTEAAGERQSTRYDVRSGAVTSRLPDQNYPESGNPQGYSFYGALTVSHAFAGRIEGNTIAGTWTAAYTPQQAWGWKDGEKRTKFYRYQTRQETRSEMRLVLNGDGTLSWSLHGVWRSKHQQLEGEGPPPEDQENTFDAAGGGVWQIRKADASSQENSP